MLVATLAVSAAVLEFNNSEPNVEEYWSAGLIANLIALWAMLVTSIAIIIDLICVPLRIIITVTKYYRINAHNFLGNFVRTDFQIIFVCINIIVLSGRHSIYCTCYCYWASSIWL